MRAKTLSTVSAVIGTRRTRRQKLWDHVNENVTTLPAQDISGLGNDTDVYSSRAGDSHEFISSGDPGRRR